MEIESKVTSAQYSIANKIYMYTVYSHILNYQPSSYLFSYGCHSIVQLQTQRSLINN